MAQVIFQSGAIVGHQYVNTSGYTIGVDKTSGSFPAWGTYDITSASLSISYVRSDQRNEVTVYMNSEATGNEIGYGWNHTSPGVVSLSNNTDYSGLTTLILCGDGGTAMQIGSGAVITVTIDYVLKDQKSTLTIPSAAEIGSSVLCSIKAYSSSYKHKLTFKFVSTAKGEITLGSGVTTYNKAITRDFLNQIPNATHGLFYVKLETLKSDGTSLGETGWQSMTLNCPTNQAWAKPTLAGAVSRLLTVGGKTYFAATGGLYIQNHCGLTAALSGATGAYGSTILLSTINIGNGMYTKTGTGNMTFASGLLKNSGTVPVVFTVTDSRGMKTSVTKTVTVTAYSKPGYTTFTVCRCNVSSVFDEMGDYAKAIVDWVYTNVGGNTCTATLACAGVTYTLPSANFDSRLFPSGYMTFNKLYSYIVTLSLTDKFETATTTIKIPSANYFVHFNVGGNGIGIGQAISKTKALEVNPEWDVYIKGQKQASVPSGGEGGYVLRRPVSPGSDTETVWGNERIVRVSQDVFDAYTVTELKALYASGVLLLDVSGRGLFNLWSGGTYSDAMANKWNTADLIIRMGTVSIALAASTKTNNAKIAYSGFTSAPKVFANPRTTAPCDRNVSVISATTTGATIYADNPYTSAGSLVVDWLAIGK